MLTAADIKRHRQSYPELDAIFRRAEANDSTSAPRKHHVVPASYLRRWEGERHTIRMTDALTRHTTLLSPRKALKHTDFYRLESPDIEVGTIPPQLMETLLSDIEAQAKRILDEYIRTGSCDDPQEMAWLAWFFAMQITRGVSNRLEQAHITTNAMKLQFSGWTDETIREFLVRKGDPAEPDDVASARRAIDDVAAGNVWIAPQDPAAAAMSAKMALEIGETLLGRRWLIFRSPYGGLITCDEPVVMVPEPGEDRGQRPGVANAGVIIVALDPHTLLAMFRRDLIPTGAGRIPGLLPSEVHELDVEIAANSHRWLIEQPQRSATLSLPLPLPAQLFAQEGPLPGDTHGSELYRSFKPTRWANTSSPPPPPIERWWE
jgi:hypothetical protein